MSNGTTSSSEHGPSLLNAWLEAVTPKPGSWRPTPHMRLVAEHLEASLARDFELQQLWVDDGSDEEEWRPVEIVWETSL